MRDKPSAIPTKTNTPNIVINKSNTKTSLVKVKPLNVTTNFIFPHNLKTAPQAKRRSPSMAKGVGLRLLSRRGSWVQIPPSAPIYPYNGISPNQLLFVLTLFQNGILRALTLS